MENFQKTSFLNIGKRSEGLVLITAGILLLLNTQGILGWQIWLNFLPFFLPSLFIFLGLKVIFNNAPYVDLLWNIVLCVLLILGATVSINQKIQPVLFKEETVKVEDAIKNIDLSLDNAFNSLEIKDITNEDSAKIFYKGAYINNFNEVKLEQNIVNNKMNLNFKQGGSISFNPFMGFNSVNSDLKSNVSLFNLKQDSLVNLNLKNSFGSVKLMQENSNIQKLQLQNSFGSSEFEFKKYSPNYINIQNSFGNVKIILPKEIGYKLKYNTSFGNVKIDGQEVKGESNGLVSKNVTAEKVLEIDAHSSFGSVEIDSL